MQLFRDHNYPTTAGEQNERVITRKCSYQRLKPSFESELFIATHFSASYLHQKQYRERCERK